jgi:hypothetical protein
LSWRYKDDELPSELTLQPARLPAHSSAWRFHIGACCSLPLAQIRVPPSTQLDLIKSSALRFVGHQLKPCVSVLCTGMQNSSMVASHPLFGWGGYHSCCHLKNSSTKSCYIVQPIPLDEDALDSVTLVSTMSCRINIPVDSYFKDASSFGFNAEDFWFHDVKPVLHQLDSSMFLLCSCDNFWLQKFSICGFGCFNTPIQDLFPKHSPHAFPKNASLDAQGNVLLQISELGASLILLLAITWARPLVSSMEGLFVNSSVLLLKRTSFVSIVRRNYARHSKFNFDARDFNARNFNARNFDARKFLFSMLASSARA